MYALCYSKSFLLIVKKYTEKIRKKHTGIQTYSYCEYYTRQNIIHIENVPIHLSIKTNLPYFFGNVLSSKYV